MNFRIKFPFKKIKNKKNQKIKAKSPYETKNDYNYFVSNTLLRVLAALPARQA
jgi:hypothetical protein